MDSSHLVSWSVETLVLALNLIAAICAIYIAAKAFQTSPKWGLFFVAIPIAYLLLYHWFGVLVAGFAVLAAQLAYFRVHYNWETLGRFYVYTVICWLGVAAIHVRESGWFTRSTRDSQIEQAGGPGEESSSRGFVNVEGGRIWYSRSGSGKGTPVILVHGGPGAGSFSLKPLESLGSDRPVIRYDQLGTGHSEKVYDTTLFTTARFVSELDSLRANLQLERVHLAGHWWGALLALEYYRAHPDRVASLTLASPLLSAPEWNKSVRRLVATLSDSAQRAIGLGQRTGDFAVPAYESAMNEYREKYVSRRPVSVDRDSAASLFNEKMYHYLWGTTDLSITGSLRSYDATGALRSVKVPTLYTVGEFDLAGPETVRRFASRTPGAELQVIPDAAHMVMWDNPEPFVQRVRDFLRSVDSTTAR